MLRCGAEPCPRCPRHALVATGATAAVAAPAAAPKPSSTINASKTSVKLHDAVTFTGRTEGLKAGSKVTLQVEDGAAVSKLVTVTVR